MLKALAISAERNGYLAWHYRQAICYNEALLMARREHKSGLEQNAFMAGWNMARWGRSLAA